jgi:hypothetical protein
MHSSAARGGAKRELGREPTLRNRRSGLLPEGPMGQPRDRFGVPPIEQTFIREIHGGQEIGCDSLRFGTDRCRMTVRAW